MSVRIPSRRLGQTALAAFCKPSTRWIPSASLSTTSRCALNINPLKKKEEEPDLSNPTLEKYLKERKPQAELTRPTIREGGLSTHPSSLFRPDSELEIPGWRDDLSPEAKEELREAEKQRRAALEKEKEYNLSALQLDPAPKARRRWERKMVIKGLTKHGRLSKNVKIMRSERQSIFKSAFFPTSTKKMTRIMHLIAGKTVDEALVQLRFSKKRIARDVYKGLLVARDEAIAARGMGLGGDVKAPAKTAEEEVDEAEENESTEEPYVAERTRKERGQNQPQIIELKDGSKKLVRDPTEIYIDQAWVGRGEYWMSPEFRARGKVNMLRHRTTSFAVLLKEEKTRIRLSNEIKKKRDNRKLWVGLPDRPITSQRQYCLW